MIPVYGAGRDLARQITTHLFVISPNNSGSTFLKEALSTCRATWNLSREGQWMLGYAGPVPGNKDLAHVELLWASTPCLIDRLSDTSAYDWRRTRRAWYFQAYARDPRASVFVTKSPPHLLLADDLARCFVNPKFLFMVRNPYAVCQGICRYMTARLPFHDPDLPDNAARHVVACLEYQRRNIQTHRSRGLFLTYEEMCAEPDRVAAGIRTLVPELNNLELRQRLPVKGEYDEMLTDMNARQIARLDPGQIAAFNRVFRKHRKLLDHFGYEMMQEDR